MSDLEEERFDKTPGAPFSGTGIYAVKIRLEDDADIPNMIPMFGKRVKLYYRGVQKQCSNCFATHQKGKCENERVTWLEYVFNFICANPDIPRDYFGKWTDIVEEKIGKLPIFEDLEASGETGAEFENYEDEAENDDQEIVEDHDPHQEVDKHPTVVSPTKQNQKKLQDNAQGQPNSSHHGNRYESTIPDEVEHQRGSEGEVVNTRTTRATRGMASRSQRTQVLSSVKGNVQQTRNQEKDEAIDLVKQLKSNKKVEITRVQVDRDEEQYLSDRSHSTSKESRKEETSDDVILKQMIDSGIPLERAMRLLALEHKDDLEFVDPSKKKGRPPNKKIEIPKTKKANLNPGAKKN